MVSTEFWSRKDLNENCLSRIEGVMKSLKASIGNVQRKE
jgi:hypothetical protein